MNCPHCNTHIDEHPASRCLDAWVAEAVMGWQPITHFHGSPIADGWTGFWDGEWFRWTECPESDEPDASELWLPSIDIAAAWQVVEKICNWDIDDNMLTLMGQGPDIEMELPDSEESEWWKAEISGTRGKIKAEAPTAPLAISRAAIMASSKLP